jgi:hypothetical protein
MRLLADGVAQVCLENAQEFLDIFGNRIAHKKCSHNSYIWSLQVSCVSTRVDAVMYELDAGRHNGDR